MKVSRVVWRGVKLRDYKTKPRQHTTISTENLPCGIFLGQSLRSKIITPWDTSQHQTFVL